MDDFITSISISRLGNGVEVMCFDARGAEMPFETKRFSSPAGAREYVVEMVSKMEEQT